MKKRTLIAPLFIVASLYDGLLGLVFLFAPLHLFTVMAVPPPNHPGYVQFPAALLIVFAIMFMRVAMDPDRNASLIPYGILLKAAYCGTVFYYWITTGIPDMWKPFAIADLVFGVLFLWAYCTLRTCCSSAAASSNCSGW